MKILLAILLMLFAALPAHAQRATVVQSCATQSVPVGSKTNWTMDPQGRVCMGQNTVLSCQQSVNYLARTTGGNEGGNAANISALICGLVADGLITGSLTGATGGCGAYLDALWVMAQQNAADAALNLCGTSYSLTPPGGFTAYQGFASGTGIPTGFNAAIGTNKFIQNSASMGVWSNGVTASSSCFICNSTNAQLYPRFTDNFFYPRINGGGASMNIGTFSGLFAADRSSAAANDGYVNGINRGQPASSASSAVSNSGFLIGVSSPQIVNAAFIGGSLGPARQLALYNRLQTYMTAPCPQAANYLARTQGGNEGGNATNISNLICGLAADGVITGDLSGAAGCGAYLDVLFLFAQQNQADADLNLCGTSFKASSFPTNIFQSYIGYHGFSTNNIVANWYDPTIVPGAHYTINNASMGAWFYTLPVEATLQVGLNGDLGNSIWAQYNAGGSFFARITNNVIGAVTQIANKGFFVGDRQDSSGVYPYYNGAQLAFQAVVGKPIASAPFTIGGLVALPSVSTISEAHIGGSLGAAKETALYNRLRTYMTAVGVP